MDGGSPSIVPGVNPPPSGRHAKPPTDTELAVQNAIRALASERNRRRLIAIAGVAAGMLLVVTLAVLTMSGGTRSGPARRHIADAVAATKRASPSPSYDAIVGRGTTDSEPAALTYFQSKDQGVAGHVKDVRWSGQFLRVYTDYPETADNSKAALELCQWTWDYLSSHGSPGPLFVQGTSSDNGAVVLAKKLDAKDSCRVGPTG
jgi:hypothetical protein